MSSIAAKTMMVSGTRPKARPISSTGPDIGRLKVSFFGPFYGGYNIIELDKQEYAYSLVSGPNRDYLWILARSPDLDDGVVERLVNLAGELGFPTDELIFVEHTAQPH